jgi:FlaA1/EpsC-like NDP-sugar epimerase
MSPEPLSPPPAHVRNRYLFASDILLFGSSTIVAFALRFEGFVWGDIWNQAALLYLTLSLPIKLLVFWAVGMYRRLWRYAGIVEVERVISASALSGLACLLVGLAILPGLRLTEMRIPISVLFMDGLLTGAAASLPRFAVRSLGRRGQRRRLEDARRAIIAGAGAAGEMIVKELLSHPQLGLNPIGFVDDDAS